MLLGPYTLEIIVDGSPIPEISEPVRNLKVPTSTGPSYVFNELTGQWHISDSITLAKVRDLGSHFAVRFSSSSVSPCSPLMAYLVIDGQLDYRYVEIYNTEFHSRDHFLSSDKSTKYFFKFNHSIWSDAYQPEGCDGFDLNTRYGGLGAVSLYFYRARSINEKCDIMPQVDIRQLVLPERKVTRDITISTGFDVTFNPLGLTIPNMNYLQSLYSIPVGVLHLHYRPVNFVSLPIHYPPCEFITHYFTRDTMMDPKQGSKCGGILPIKQGPECNESLQVPDYNEILSRKQEPECNEFLSLRHVPKLSGFTPIKQEDVQFEVFSSVNQENEDSNQFITNVREEIKEELNLPIKIETICMITKRRDFVDHKKNKAGGRTKTNKNHRTCKKNLRKQ